MSSTCRAWIVAASVGAVEALKDQGGLFRWNHALRSLHQHVKANTGSCSQAKRPLPSNSNALVNMMRSDDLLKQSEESLRKVMYLSCWGPN